MISKDLESLKIRDDYKKVKISDILKEKIGTKIQTFGWIIKIRSQGKMTFMDLYSGFKTVKCVTLSKKEHKNFNIWTSLRVFGEIKKNIGKDKNEHKFELLVENYSVVGTSPSFPINSETSTFTTLELGHLFLRTSERRFFLKARSVLLKIIRDFFYENKFIEITPPTIVKTQVEGGSTLFNVEYYNSKAYLTQSSQLYLETVVPVSEKAFCIMPSYRAEKSNTTRHLSEYTHVEAEVADISFEDLEETCEKLIIYSMTRFYDEMSEDIKELYKDFEFVEIPKEIKRMKYSEAIEYLILKKHLKHDDTPYKMGDDISDNSERFLCSEFNSPIFLTNFLSSHKPFYMKRTGINKEETESLDILFPGVGEILGGSMRCDNYYELMEGFKREKIDPSPYYWYTDLLKYGTFSHGGFGLGFERFLMGLMKWKNVNKSTLYPRFTTRCSP